MGTSNFLYNHRLDVISGTSYNAFDFEAYNKGLDECDRLEEGDYDSIGDILHWNLQDTITDLKYRAEEPYRKSLESGISCWKKESVDGFRILSTTEEADDDRKYADRCYGGTVTARLFSEGKIVEKRLIAGWKEAEDVFASVVTMASDYANRIVTPETLDLYHQVLAWYQEECFW